jgi:beta-alanine degradation protein BauB
VDPEHGTFDVAEFSDELDGAPSYTIGTKMLLENDWVRIWEIRLEPGERAPFHHHAHTYLFVCVDPGRARSRFVNGTYIDLDYEEGTVWFSDYTEQQPEIHDLENVGSTTLRFTTVELL